MTPAVAARVSQLAAENAHRNAIGEFRARQVADRQARSDALLLEAIDALARALLEVQPSPRECRGCGRSLGSRTRRCPSCHYQNAAARAAA